MTSIVLVEDSIEQFIATLSIVNFTELISVFKSRGIGFVLHIDPDLRTLQDRLIHHFNYINPLILHGAQIRSVVPSPALGVYLGYTHLRAQIKCKGSLVSQPMVQSDSA